MNEMKETEMKFYNFKGFEYYALIVARKLEDAVQGYKKVVAELDSTAKEPKEISKDAALKEYMKESRNENDKKTYVEWFDRELKSFRKSEDKYSILLIDRALF